MGGMVYWHSRATLDLIINHVRMKNKSFLEEPGHIIGLLWMGVVVVAVIRSGDPFIVTVFSVFSLALSVAFAFYASHKTEQREKRQKDEDED